MDFIDHKYQCLELAAEEFVYVVQISNLADSRRLTRQLAEDVEQFHADTDFYERMLNNYLWGVYGTLTILSLILIPLFFLTDVRMLGLSLSVLAVVGLAEWFGERFEDKLLPTWELHQEIGELLVEQTRCTAQGVIRMEQELVQRRSQPMPDPIHVERRVAYNFMFSHPMLYKAQYEYERELTYRGKNPAFDFYPPKRR